MGFTTVPGEGPKVLSHFRGRATHTGEASPLRDPGYPPTPSVKPVPGAGPSARTDSEGGFSKSRRASFTPSLEPQAREGTRRHLPPNHPKPGGPEESRCKNPRAGPAAACSRLGPAQPPACGRGQPRGLGAPGRVRISVPPRVPPAHRSCFSFPAAPPGPCRRRQRAAPPRTRLKFWSTTSTRSTSTRTPPRCASSRPRPASRRRRPR